jgi:hypothetical protein
MSQAEQLLQDLWMNAINDKVQPTLHALLYARFTHIPTHLEDAKYFSAVNCALVLMFLREGGVWLTAGKIMQLIAALMYLIRSMMLCQMHQLAMSQSEWVFKYILHPHAWHDTPQFMLAPSPTHAQRF